MPAVVEQGEEDDFEFDDDLMIFPITDIDGVRNEHDGDGDDEYDNSDHDGASPTRKLFAGRFRPVMTLKERRRSLLSATGLPSEFPNLSVKMDLRRLDSGIDDLSPKARWKRAVQMIRTMKDPWAEFAVADLPVETVTRHRYHALKRKWVVDKVIVKMELEPFNHGAMRACYRLKKLSPTATPYSNNWKQQAHNYVAKVYMEAVDRKVYFEDVRLQMDAKLWGEEYNRHHPPKKVDIFQMSILEFNSRPGNPLYHLEHYIEGEYIKYNSNSGFVDEHLRYTPQAFSHFTFERSGHKMIVVDIQGVGDLWTDPQIHTSEGLDYGDGNLGTKGMALFFHSHICNSICESLRLSKFDLAETEQSTQVTFIIAQCNSMTRVRGEEEVCMSVSPAESMDIMSFLVKRNRTISTASSVFSAGNSDDDMHSDSYSRGGLDDDNGNGDFCLSPVTPPSFRPSRRRFLSESDESASATTTEEEERTRFHMQARMSSRPSCVALDIGFRGMHDEHRPGDSVLGQIHHELAKYHEMGRFTGQGDPIDASAALFHERTAADLGVKEAIVTLASIYLGLPHDVLNTVIVENNPSNYERGMEYMLRAANVGDRGAMIHMAKSYEAGIEGTCEKSYVDAAKWYQKAVEMTHEDECGEFDATMDNPVYQLKAAMAHLYMVGGYGLDKDPSYAGELFIEAADGATTAMKGRLASQYYALSEEAWAQVEE